MRAALRAPEVHGRAAWSRALQAARLKQGVRPRGGLLEGPAAMAAWRRLWLVQDRSKPARARAAVFLIASSNGWRAGIASGRLRARRSALAALAR